MRKQRGFTLVELLISLLIAGLVLVGVSSIINSSAQDSNRISLNADIIKEGQIAQQLITGRLSEAIYVWWPTVTSSRDNILLAATGPTTQNTVAPTGGGDHQWKVAPSTTPNVFLAMVLPPRAPTYAVGTNTINNCTSTAKEGCYQFFAYYPMLRSNLSALADAEKPKADPLNDNQWVLMEYRANMIDGTDPWLPNYNLVNGINQITPAGVSPPERFYQSTAAAPRSGVLLVDYIRPNSVRFNVTRPNGVITGNARPDGRVEFAFQMQRLTGGTSPAFRATGNSADILGATVSPRNWACPVITSCP